MDYRTLIRNGTVVDGTGRPAYRADVRIRAGRIAEIAPQLEPRDNERVFDASGCYVTPGFIEAHNHWDAAVWWSPNMEPFPGYGVTTSINGNCGFSLAPLPQDGSGRDDIVDIFNFFEDIPEVPMKSTIPWDWHKWSDYKASHERNVRTPVNFASFCGHIPMRLAVMGEAAWHRAATEDEVERMCALLDDALAAGAMGLSSNQLDHDKHDRPLPSQLADDAEYLALLRVVAHHRQLDAHDRDQGGRTAGRAMRAGGGAIPVGRLADAGLSAAGRQRAVGTARTVQGAEPAVLDGLHACPVHVLGRLQAYADLRPAWPAGLAGHRRDQG
jgi:N-acyl-D-amino-acid deacylase